VTTFNDLTRSILSDARSRLRVLSGPAERELLRRVVRQAIHDDQLKYFADAARRGAFIDLLSEHFRELKRADISSASYAKKPAPRTSKEEHYDLALLYSEYESLLGKHSLIDEEGAHLAARDALAAEKAASFSQLALIAVDGFTDFTRTQHDILRLLSERATQLVITLPADQSLPLPPGEGRGEGKLPDRSTSPRSDLFAKTTATLDELKRRYAHLEIHPCEARALPVPALDHAARHVFRNPNQIPPPLAEAIASLDRIRIIAAASAHDEIVQIARRIKHQLATRAAKPGDIAVVVRSLTDAAPRIREVFAEFGIPFHLAAAPPLTTAPVVKTLLSLLRLDDEDWPFRRVVSIITNNMLTAFDAAARQATEWIVRELQIASGRDTLLNRVGQHASIDATPELSEHAARRATAAKAAQPLLQRLAQTFDALPETATLADWSTALERFLHQLGITSDVDATAWDALKLHLGSVDRLDAWLLAPARSLDRRELLSALIDVASHESLPQPYDDTGRVPILAAPAARTIDVKHLYLAGMSEQAFPSPERAGRLATDADYRFLMRAADQDRAASKSTAPPDPTRAQGEMLLFYELLSRPQQSLTISYPALDDKAQVLPPSPYVLELQRVFGKQGAAQLQPPPPQLSPVPQDANVCGPADWRIAAVARAIEREPNRRLLAGIFASPETQELGHALDAALRIIYDRAHGDSFGPAEGLLTGPGAAASLAQRFGQRHYWSPSQWETYAACPYKFFLEDVLNLEPLGDLVLETDYTRRGSRLHDVLATFHRRWKALREGDAIRADEQATQFVENLERVINDRINVASHDGIDAALLELDRRQIEKWAAKHFDHHQKYDGNYTRRGVQLTPTHLEYRFGPSRTGDADQDPDSVESAFVLDIGSEKIRVTGQIDRIDVGTLDGQTMFSVIDYKSGRKPALRTEDIESGQRLQLPLYVEAAQTLVFKGTATPIAAGYWSMASGFDARGALAVEVEVEPAVRWADIREKVRERVAQFVKDIRSGAFPVASRDDKCTSFCDFNTICRIAQIRSLNKVWGAQVESQESRDKS
jgi:ATP-dependent helicase/DNAse subunit B